MAAWRIAPCSSVSSAGGRAPSGAPGQGRRRRPRVDVVDEEADVADAVAVARARASAIGLSGLQRAGDHEADVALLRAGS